MERILVMIRHAKSSWANPLQSDFERPLNERGEKDAPIMALQLKKHKLIPDLIIASTAKRARQTAKKIAMVLGYDEAKIQWQEKLYHCIPSVFEEVLYDVADDVRTVFIVAHNPGITDFVNELSDGFRTDNMPTCSIVATKFKAAQWNEFSRCAREVFLFEYPKNLK
jgi:phosphohistidine phosphatase